VFDHAAVREKTDGHRILSIKEVVVPRESAIPHEPDYTSIRRTTCHLAPVGQFGDLVSRGTSQRSEYAMAVVNREFRGHAERPVEDQA
jgi:hypothetical protein